MIKAVLQSIPAYSMSLFKFPKSLINDLYRLCASFWWGLASGAKKLYWAFWDKLCISKGEGGLGFRDLGAFNQALLGKQCWRLIQDPTSLAARVLKGCYFPFTSLLKASSYSLGSFVWKSILWGELVSFRWRIGNGASVLVYHDRLIPRPSTFKVFSLPSLGSHVTVDKLKVPTGGWDISLLRNHFLPADVEAILSLPSSAFRVDDSLLWHFENSGPSR
ncbi:hypothetical protein ACOSP7_010252 [Xanthoceras sorbifolium]